MKSLSIFLFIIILFYCILQESTIQREIVLFVLLLFMGNIGYYFFILLLLLIFCDTLKKVGYFAEFLIGKVQSISNSNIICAYKNFYENGEKLLITIYNEIINLFK